MTTAKQKQVRRRANGPPLRVLFAASEVYPLVKTGGLADAAASLPPALHQLGVDIRIAIPGYRSVLEAARPTTPVAMLPAGTAAEPVRLLRATLPRTDVPVYIVEAPSVFDRDGGPYQDETGKDWPDNAERFALFCRALVPLCLGKVEGDWKPDLLHCNDWHTGLAPALLAAEPGRPATVFTIHSLAYQGNFPYQTFTSLGLPTSMWSPDALEFHGMLSFIKGGLVYADRITTVSPGYADEILTKDYGHGLDGLLRHRRKDLRGILNGADYQVWDPRHDEHIAKAYWSNRLAGKQEDKLALQRRLGLEVSDKAFLLGSIARLTWQKGTDILLDALPALLEDDAVQLALLGSGEPSDEDALRYATGEYRGRIAAVTGYDEALAHQIQAGSDAFLMPSRFEPCGLTQLYAMRYGTVPIVRRTGGLADTVVDVTDTALADGSATGFQFARAEAADLVAAVKRAMTLWRDRNDGWKQVMRTGMKQEFSWSKSAQEYDRLYRSITVSNARALSSPLQ